MNRTMKDLSNKLMKGKIGSSKTSEGDPLDTFKGTHFKNPPHATHKTYHAKRKPTNGGVEGVDEDENENEDETLNVPRKRGRPHGLKNLKDHIEENENETETTKVPRKRGRPSGSKNLKGTSRLCNNQMMSNSQPNTIASFIIEVMS